MQTTIYMNLTTTCTSKDCTRCVKKHGTCPLDADADSTEEVAA